MWVLGVERMLPFFPTWFLLSKTDSKSQQKLCLRLFSKEKKGKKNPIIFSVLGAVKLQNGKEIKIF